MRKQSATAAKLAPDDLEGHGEPAASINTRRAEEGGFTVEQVLGDWFPDPPG